MESFLDPKGGDPRGSFFWSAPGIALDFGLMGAGWLHSRSLLEKNIGRTANLFARTGLTPREAAMAHRRAKEDVYRWGHTRVSPGPGRRATRELIPGGRELAAKKVQRARHFGRLKRAALDHRGVTRVLQGQSPGRLSPAVREAQSFMKMGKFFKGMGIAFLMEGMFELGLGLSTPGVSRVAQKSNEMLFADERVMDTSAAFTQRQRALQAIHDSQLTARGIIGQESRYLHR